MMRKPLALCLPALLLASLPDLAGAQVLDLGCGYGVIGIAAALAGAAHVDLVDASLLAVAATAENLAWLGLSNASVYASDVLSFPADAPLRAAPEDIPIIGDVIVSAGRAAEYAHAHGIAVDEELGRYVVHGVLHCIGYDDTTDMARTAMAARQELLLHQWRAAGGGRVCRVGARRR